MSTTTAFKQGLLDQAMRGEVYHAPSTDRINVALHFANGTSSNDPLTNSATFTASHTSSGSNDSFADVQFDAADGSSVSDNTSQVSNSNVQSGVTGVTNITWVTLHLATDATTTFANAIMSIAVSGTTFSDGDTVQINIGALDVSIT